VSEKRRLRKEIREQLKALTPASREEQSQRICGLIEEHPLWQKYKCILGFYPFREEVNLLPLYKKGLQHGKELYLPRMEGEKMDFRPCDDLNSLEANSFGIFEPPARAPLFRDTKECVMLLPGLLFTTQGKRLGWGGGYYDRWLQVRRESSRLPGILAGIAYREQLRAALPVDSWDIAVNHLVSPDGFIPCS